MAYIGKTPTPVPLTSSDITDGIVSIADLATTGTASSSTFLRGDGAFAEAGGLVDTKFVTFQGTQSHTGNSFADVTDLTITHTCSNSSNKIKKSEFSKIGETNPKASVCIRTCPNASEKVRMGPNRSEHIVKLRKAC